MCRGIEEMFKLNPDSKHRDVRADAMASFHGLMGKELLAQASTMQHALDEQDICEFWRIWSTSTVNAFNDFLELTTKGMMTALMHDRSTIITTTHKSCCLNRGMIHVIAKMSIDGEHQWLQKAVPHIGTVGVHHPKNVRWAES